MKETENKLTLKDVLPEKIGFEDIAAFVQKWIDSNGGDVAFFCRFVRSASSKKVAECECGATDDDISFAYGDKKILVDMMKECSEELDDSKDGFINW